MNFIFEKKVREKIRLCREQASKLKGGGFAGAPMPEQPGRDVQVLSVHQLPKKLGLSHPLGVSKLIHDLANIELQAMELAARTLIEFSGSNESFRDQLCVIMLEEALHLELCLDELRRRSVPWGQWPVHLGLWAAVSKEDTLLDRIFIVHRYLEASGLDAGDKILKRLSGVPEPEVRGIVARIVKDEVGHVAFGTRWYRHYCEQNQIDPEVHYFMKTKNLLTTNPRPGKIAKDLRRQAGYSSSELESLSQLQMGAYSATR